MIEPYWTDGKRTIYHGDCREILPTLGRFDLLLTDPPYEIHAGNGGGCFGGRNHLVKTGGFTDGGCDYSFLDSHPNWFVFCSKKQLPSLIKKAAERPRWNLITWCKPNPVPTCNNKYLPDVEYVVHAFLAGRLFGEMRHKSCFASYPAGIKTTDHPNEKPLPLIRRFMFAGSQPGDSILDPFMGSGTTLVAAKLEGLEAVGIELSEKYCEAAVKRLQQNTLDFIGQ